MEGFASGLARDKVNFGALLIENDSKNSNHKPLMLNSAIFNDYPSHSLSHFKLYQAGGKINASSGFYRWATIVKS